MYINELFIVIVIKKLYKEKLPGQWLVEELYQHNH